MREDHDRSKSSTGSADGLHKVQRRRTQTATGRGWKPRSGRNAWCRRWSTASKEADGTV